MAGRDDDETKMIRAERDARRGDAVIDGSESEAALEAVDAERTTVIQRFYRNEIAAILRPRPR